MKEMFVNLEKFCTSLKFELNSNDLSVALAADNDLDGLFSAIKLDMGIYELFGTEVETYFRSDLYWDIPLDKEFDLLIMMDLAYDNTPNYRNTASKAKRTFAIDHHITNEKGFPRRVTAYNPCRNGQCYQPTTFLVDEILKKLGQDKSPLNEYLNLLGILADAGINFCVDAEKNIQYSFDQSLEDIFITSKRQFTPLFEKNTFDNFVYPQYKETLEALSFECGELGWKEVYFRFINEVTDLTTAQELVRKIERKNKNVFFDVIQQIPKEPTELTKSGIWLVKNLTSISNGVIGRLIAELFGKAVVTYSCAKFCRVSARAPVDSTINFIPIFSSFGGGHPKACGAFLTPKKFQEFLEIVREI
ncbi:MAG: hypothetical protein ACFE9A_16315 [Candidatus Hodarchaeota archaeon]